MRGSDGKPLVAGSLFLEEENWSLKFKGQKFEKVKSDYVNTGYSWELLLRALAWLGLRQGW